MLYHIAELVRGGGLPDFPIYLDSPMAIDATKLYGKHKGLFDTEARTLARRGQFGEDLRELRYLATPDESRRLNDLDGPAVVLLHGFPERASHWDGVTRLLHEQGYRTLAPDQRGYSPGARPRRRSSYRMSKLVGDVVALIEEYGDPVHLVGHDWGAAVAWTLAGSRPDLVLSLTTVSVHPAEEVS